MIETIRALMNGQEITKVVLANIIEIVVMAGVLFSNTIINRRKNLIAMTICDAADILVYILLGTTRGIMSACYTVIREITVGILHRKEEKIIQSNVEVILLGLPYLIFGLINYKDGMWEVFMGLAMFINASAFWCKRDIDRYGVMLACDAYFLIYGVIIKNYTNAVVNIIEMGQFGINIFRIRKNGEGKYYTQKNKRKRIEVVEEK